MQGAPCITDLINCLLTCHPVHNAECLSHSGGPESDYPFAEQRCHDHNALQGNKVDSPFEIPIYSLKGAQTGTPLEDSMADGTTASVHFDLPLVSCHQPLARLHHICPTLLSHPVVSPWGPTLLTHPVDPLCYPTLLSHPVPPMLLPPCCPTLLLHPVAPSCCPTLGSHPVVPACYLTLVSHPIVPCPTLLCLVFCPILFLRTLSLFQ